jgi:hypothetical protein
LVYFLEWHAAREQKGKRLGNRPKASPNDRSWKDPKWRQAASNNLVKMAMAVVASGLAAIAYYVYGLLFPPAITVTLDCLPVAIPITRRAGDSFHGVFLHPKWGDHLVRSILPTAPAGQAPPLWPSEFASPGVPYGCSLASVSDIGIAAVTIPFKVHFGSMSAGIRERMIRLGVPSTLSKGASFKFYLVDDSGWSPTVTLPSEGEGRLIGENRNRPVKIGSASGQAATRPTLSGFGR